MNKVKVCIIDESIEIDTLSELISDIPPIHIVPIYQYRNTSEICHGTICLALLLEALQNHNLMDKVSITHYSVTENGKPRTYRAFISALQYCARNKMDIVSISMGVMSRIYAGEINQVLNTLRDTLIVASASNNCKLTYPAAIPSVLGVKISPPGLAPRYTIVDNPPDGVDLIANLPKSSVMRIIERKYQFISADSNSFSVPQVCAEIISKSLDNGIIATKELALKWLKGDVKSDNKSYSFFSKETIEDNKLPIIHLEYNGEITGKVLSKAKRIKSRFDSQLYACTLLAETVKSDDFIQGLYRLDPSFAANCIDYYQYVVSDSLIIVLSRKETVPNYPFDFVITNWVEMDTSDICRLILQQFQEEEQDEKEK